MACRRSCRRRQISSHGRRSECRTPRCARSRERRHGGGSALRRRRFRHLNRERRPGPHRAGAGARAGNPPRATHRTASRAARSAETARPWAFPARHDMQTRCLLCLTQRLPCKGNLNHFFSVRSNIAELASVSIIGEYCENLNVASVGSDSVAVGEVQNVPDRAARSHSERAGFEDPFEQACLIRRAGAPCA